MEHKMKHRMKDTKRQRAYVGKTAPKILVRCPEQVFRDLHALADAENKSLNLTAIEVWKLGLAVHPNGKSPDLSRLLA